MTDPSGAGTDRSDRGLLVALAVCCAGPMLLIIVLTTVLGVAVGPAAAIALGTVGAGVCVAVMAQHHRRHRIRSDQPGG
ncbi:MAG TPA: hypothetical protein PKE56_00970 [Acidimicrobiales bacterium]|jgi:hypothetical protein|nr:hypothetical protein [Acidimicrobiales bacterium]